MKFVPPSLPRSSCSFVVLVDTVVLVLVFYLCPFSVRVVATFPGTVLFPLLCFVLPFIESLTPNTAVRCRHSSWYVCLQRDASFRAHKLYDATTCVSVRIHDSAPLSKWWLCRDGIKQAAEHVRAFRVQL